MTESEKLENAIAILEAMKKQFLGETRNVIDVAINALEKQIPKKPHKNFEKFSGVWCSFGKYLGKGYFVEKQSFCSNCGQKLDWSDGE